jgi:glycosyltransferase involved in cell wall biosynthesis
MSALPVTSQAPVTVVIPAFNRARVIERAVRSARAQQPCAPAEVVVVDDCSTDDTAARAESAGARVIRHSRNLGPGGARNTAIAQATQPWTAFLDSDDVWLPGHLRAAADAWNGRVLVSAPGLALPGETGPARLVGNGHGIRRTLDCPSAVLGPENLVATSGTIVATDAVRAAGGFPEGYQSEDLDLWMRVLEHGPGVVLPEPGYVYAPEQGHASSDAAGMRDATVATLTAYRDRPWFDAGVVRRVAAQNRWDDARAAVARGGYRAAAQQLTRLAADPRAAAAVAQLVAYRRRARRAGTRALASLSSDVTRSL